MPRSYTLPAILLSLMIILPISTVAEDFIEDFTTTEFKDPLNTIAWWDTTAGELKLFPSNPTLAGSYDTPGEARRVFVSGDHAYVTDSYSGLQVIDISDPTSPTLAGTYDTPDLAEGVFVSGDHAYVADSEAGLQVIDISDPTSPTLAGTCDWPPYRAIAVYISGDHAYVADANYGLQVIDISDPTSPTLAGGYNTPDWAIDVSVSGDHAYVADSGAGLQVIDISDPTSPTLAGSCSTPDVTYGLFVSGDHAYVACDLAGLLVIDISDPTSPTVAGTCDTPDRCLGVFVSGDYAYVGDWESGLQVIRISSPVSPTLAGSYETPGSAGGVFVSGDCAYVADGDFGLQVIDIIDPTSPTYAGSYDTPGSARGVFVSGDHAYVACDYAGLLVIDISDPTSPTFAGSYDTPDAAKGVFVSGDHAYVADFRSSGLQVIDVSDPTSPTYAGSYDTSGAALGVFVSGNHACVADGPSGLQVIDIIDPTSPTFAGSYNTPDVAFDVFVSGDHAYVADGQSGLQVIDIIDPTSPTLAGSYNTPGSAIDVSVSGDHAYVADALAGLLVIDISDPTSPTFAGSYDTPASAEGVFVSGNHAYVADWELGLLVIWISIGGPFNSVENKGQSLAVNSLNFEIPRVRLTTTQAGNVTWEISRDNGGAWQGMLPDGGWNALSPLGSELVWRSTHTYSHDGVNPTCSELRLGILYEPGIIDALVDIPEDQGGWLRLHFTRSGYDFDDEAEYPVTGYQIYRRVDEPQLSEQILTDSEPLSTKQADKVGLASFDRSHVGILDGRLFVDCERAGGDRDDFPPGTWEVVSWVAATQQDDYIALVPTLGDSTLDGITWSVYLITTHTTTPSVWFASLPDSGYSVDNLAPGPPEDFRFESPTLIAWDEAEEEDFNYFSVYGSMTPDLDEAELIDHTIETSMDVSGTGYEFFHVTATDFAGNEGQASTIGPASGTPDLEQLPQTFALGRIHPNPGRSAMTISFDLPEVEDVKVRIFDVTGRHVKTLIEGRRPAGRYNVSWLGDDEKGRPAATGIYFISLVAGDFVATGKAVVLD